MMTPDTLVWLGGLVFVLGYLIINQITLRLMVLLGTGLYIWYYAIVAEAPLWAAIWTSIAMGIANLIGLASLYFRNSRYSIPKQHLDIYPFFQTLPPGDFGSLVRLARRYRLEKDQELTVEDREVNRMYFVLSGQMTATKSGRDFILPSGIFIGEVAYLTHQPSSATIVLKAGSELLEWDMRRLRSKCRHNARFKLALEAVISTDLAGKLSLAIPLQEPPEVVSVERAIAR